MITTDEEQIQSEDREWIYPAVQDDDESLTVVKPCVELESVGWKLDGFFSPEEKYRNGPMTLMAERRCGNSRRCL